MANRSEAHHSSFFGTVFHLFKQTFQEWLDDKAPQLGAALAYYTVFSLAPLTLLILAIIGFLFRDDPAGAWNKITEQLSYFLDRSAVETVQGIAQRAAHPDKSIFATIFGIALALFGAAGVFGQLQDALNTVWGVKPKPEAGWTEFLRVRFLSFAMVAGICFLLLVSLVIESILKGVSSYLQAAVPGGMMVALVTYWIFDLGVVILLFACIFKFLPDVKIQWRDVWIGATITALFFAVRKMGPRSLSRQRKCSLSLWSGQFADYPAPLGLLFGSNLTLWGGVYPGVCHLGRTRTQA